mgnify:CR=1 FL=1
MRYTSVFMGIMIIAIWGCTKSVPDPAVSSVPYLRQPAPPWIDSLLATWTLEQKAGQLLLWEGSAADTAFYPQARALAARGYLGGIQAQGYSLQNYLAMVDSLQREAEIPLFIAASSSVLLNDHLAGIPGLPEPETVHAAGGDSLYQYLQELFARQARYLGVNLVFNTMPNSLVQPDWNQLGHQRLPVLNRHRVISAIDHFDDYYPNLADTAAAMQQLLVIPRKWIANGVGGLTVPPVVGKSCGSTNADLHTFLNRHLHFNGVVWAKMESPEDLSCLLESGYDAFRISEHPDRWRRQIAQLVASGELSEEQLNRSVRKILLAKSWMHNGVDQYIDRQRPARYTPMQASLFSVRTADRETSVSVDPLDDHFSPRVWEVFNEELERRAITLLHAPERDFPLPATRLTILDFGDQPAVHLQRQLQEYLPVRFRHGQVTPGGGYEVAATGNDRPVVVLGNQALHPQRDRSFMRWLRERRAILVNFGSPQHLGALDTTGLTIVQTFGRSRNIEESTAEILVGARGASGRLPYTINVQLPRGAGYTTRPIRLGYSRPEEVGMQGEQLVSIDAIISRAIRKRAMPGCQVLVARKGRIIYHKSFGEHTYGGRPVRETDVYDLASLTKTMATTLGIMYLYEKGEIALNDRLRDHFPELAAGNLANVTIERLLTHRSGIQPHMPVIPYLLHRGPENAACDSFFCAEPSDMYQVPVAEDFYFNKTYHDSIWTDLNEVQVKYGRRYRYSDVNFVLLQKLLERKTGKSLDQWVKEYVYEPLRLQRTTFRPLEYLSKAEIVPTENDQKWRHQLVHGYVHDETASLLGGVAGHAGLFSNARELAILSQLFLNEGQYGGHRFFTPQTIRLFRSSGHGNYRGLGFDKPYSSNRSSRAKDVSEATFGHTGFTGTCFWVDPEQELVFIFLANRVYPSARNKRFFRMEVRAQVHQEVYDALETFPTEWPSLPDVDMAPPPLLVQRSNPS